jgi:alanine racemase
MHTQYADQTWIELSQSAFNHNIAYYKQKIGEHNQLATVIKGNGYGHGLQPLAYLCQQNSAVNLLCVARLSEALAIGNCTKPILIMCHTDLSPEYAIHKNIHFMVDNIAYATMLNTIGKTHSYQFNVHVKVDTGLSRMGIDAEQTLSFVQQIQKLDYLTIVGIYSHFSNSLTDPLFTNQQYALFTTILDTLAKHNISIDHVHMSNSAAISTVNYDTSRFNLFRVGIGIYGLGPDAAHLQPIMTWKTRITAIKKIPTNTQISYNGEYRTTRPTTIALLPIGYFDGYNFRLSNKSSIMINGMLAPVIGRVTMNVTIVDITDIPAHIDDEAIIMGNYPGVQAHDLAQLADIPNVRELITGINQSFNRIIM